MKKHLSLFIICLLLLSIVSTTSYSAASEVNRAYFSAENGVFIFYNLQWGMSMEEAKALINVKYDVYGNTLTAYSVAGVYGMTYDVTCEFTDDSLSNVFFIIQNENADYDDIVAYFTKIYGEPNKPTDYNKGVIWKGVYADFFILNSTDELFEEHIRIMFKRIGTTASPEPETNYATYNNEKLGYRIKYPSAWTVTPVDGSPTGQVIFEAENKEALIVECNINPMELTNEAVLEHADKIIQGLEASAKKNGYEIAIDTEPTLYETENNDFVIIAGMVYSEKSFTFFDVYLLTSGPNLYSLFFTSLTQGFYDQIKIIADSFTII